MHEAPVVMILPLIVLAIGAVLAGFILKICLWDMALYISGKDQFSF